MGQEDRIISISKVELGENRSQESIGSIGSDDEEDSSRQLLGFLEMSFISSH